MKVLLIGSGAREHALAHSLIADPEVAALIAAPGNPGIAALGSSVTCLPGVSDVTDASAIVSAAREHDVDLVVIGPEAPLVAGVGDAVRAAGFACFGPGAAAAQLEGSKAFAKSVMAAADVRTARAQVCTTLEQVRDALDAMGSPFVVKDDGLAAGKGVVVSDDLDEAIAHAQRCLDKPEGQVVVEEFLDGPEVSLFCISDGASVVALEPAQDFKRLGDGDTGPNTGGMGAYSPLPWLQGHTPDLVQQVLMRVAKPTIAEMAQRGTPFVGVLYVGLALTAGGPRVVEFNVRFGDPETQCVLARLRTPLAGLLLAAARGTLADFPPLTWHDDAAVTVVLAAAGYPDTPERGAPITGIADAEQISGVQVLHAGTSRSSEGEDLVATGGRVLSVVGVGPSVIEARQRAYQGVAAIGMPGSQHRRDIAAHASGSSYTSMQVDGHIPLYAGKVRELYAPLDSATGLINDETLLLVASDRISAYDFVLDSPVPDKGIVLTQMSLWWFDQLSDLCPHHVVSLNVPDQVKGRGMYVRRLKMLPVECIARAYLTGGGLSEYHASGSVSGVDLPAGMVDGSELPEPIFTPSTKAADGEHDQPMTYAEVEALIGAPLAATARDLTLAILIRGNQIARERGVIIADTKVEFGIDPREVPLEVRREDGSIDWPAIGPDQVRLVLADEVLTPDSSRFWRAAQWEPGHPQTSYDKQVLRDWLTSAHSGWDRAAGDAPPELPQHIVTTTRERYVEVFEALTRQEFDPDDA